MANTGFRYGIMIRNELLLTCRDVLVVADDDDKLLWILSCCDDDADLMGGAFYSIVCRIIGTHTCAPVAFSYDCRAARTRTHASPRKYGAVKSMKWFTGALEAVGHKKGQVDFLGRPSQQNKDRLG